MRTIVKTHSDEDLMSEQRQPVLTGGCQCGAIRYALYTCLLYTSDAADE